MIDVDHGMRLRLRSTDGGPAISLLLNRIVAQQLADALLAAAGVKSSGLDRVYPARVLDFPDIEAERKRAFEEGLAAGIKAMQDSRARQASKR